MIQTPKIDVHGMTSEQACCLVRSSILHFRERGYPELYIIHGRGQGILRQRIRSILRDYAYVKMRSGGHGEGGDGVTVAVFK
jgi:DNA mismatch repair protein MutS2